VEQAFEKLLWRQGQRIKKEMKVEMAALRPFRPRSADEMHRTRLEPSGRAAERGPTRRSATSPTSVARFDASALCLARLLPRYGGRNLFGRKLDEREALGNVRVPDSMSRPDPAA
jgi:hypothetical protein